MLWERHQWTGPNQMNQTPKECQWLGNECTHAQTLSPTHHAHTCMHARIHAPSPHRRCVALCCCGFKPIWHRFFLRKKGCPWLIHLNYSKMPEMGWQAVLKASSPQVAELKLTQQLLFKQMPLRYVGSESQNQGQCRVVDQRNL